MDMASIKKAFTDNSIEIGKDDYWKVQSSYVIYHKAIERLGAAIKIRWDDIQILRNERDECVILVKASRPDNGMQEWSIGESLIGVNYKVSGKQAAYVYAMAEKRAKDRVILKLAGLHGAYSEEESDDFKRENRTDVGEAAESPARAQSKPLPKPDNVVPMKKAEAEQSTVSVAESQEGGRVVVDEDGVVQEGPSEDPFIVDLRAKLAATTEIKAVTDLMGAETLGKLKAIGPKELEAMRAYATERLKDLGWMSKKAQAE